MIRSLFYPRCSHAFLLPQAAGTYSAKRFKKEIPSNAELFEQPKNRGRFKPGPRGSGQVTVGAPPGHLPWIETSNKIKKKFDFSDEEIKKNASVGPVKAHLEWEEGEDLVKEDFHFPPDQLPYLDDEEFAQVKKKLENNEKISCLTPDKIAHINEISRRKKMNLEYTAEDLKNADDPQTKKKIANYLEYKYKVWVPGGDSYEKMSKAVDEYLKKNPQIKCLKKDEKSKKPFFDKEMEPPKPCYGSDADSEIAIPISRAIDQARRRNRRT